MKLTVKTLTQRQHVIHVEPQDKIINLKEKLLPLEIGSTHILLMTLIFQGKILKDESTVEENCLKEDDFLVLLVSNANRQKQVKLTESTPVAATAESTSVTKNTLSTESKDDSLPQKTTSSVGSEERTGAADSVFAVGPELEGIILNLMEMGGFERDVVIKALRAAFNNPDRAAEFLFSGHIPETSQAGPPGSITRPPRGPLNPNSPLAFLGQDPQFQQLKSVIMQNPSMAAPILQQIGAANPRLLQLINENQEDFLALMEEGLEDVGMEFLDTAAVDDDDSGNAGEEMADEEDPELSRIVQASLEGQQEEAPAAGAPMSQYIQVSPDEKGAIDRLVGLGFERARVIEAFFACDKNETLAANFLFDNMNEE